jgi:hypothetical protein
LQIPTVEGSLVGLQEKSQGTSVHELSVLMVVLLFWEYRRRRQSKHGKKRRGGCSWQRRRKPTLLPCRRFVPQTTYELLIR